MRKLVLSGTILVASAASAAAQSPDPVGEWLVEDGSARIKVVSCPQPQGQPPLLWGVIWAEARPGKDASNPEPSMRGRPMLGVPILIGMRQTQANLWQGKIYDARGGSIYDSKLSLSRNDMLEVRGCVAGFLCGGQDWRRVTGTNTPPLHDPAAPTAASWGQSPPTKGAATPPQSKSAATPPSQQTKGAAMARGGPATPPVDPICSNVASLVPRG